MTSLSPENTSPRVARRRRKVPKNPTVIKRFGSPDEIRTKAKAVTLAIDRLRDDRGENMVSPIKPFPSPDKREKIVKMIEISDERLENSFGFDKEEDRELITNILTVRTRRRGEKEIALLQKAFKSIKFFEQVEKEVDSISFNRIFQKLTLETFESGETIFDYDDIGRKFYIIIKGSVYILLKKENARNFAKRGSVRANNEEIGKARKNMRAYFEENELEENKQSYVEKCYPGFWIVRIMGEGDSFGEIALNKNSDGLRTATVLCKEKTTVGILSYNDYQAILGNLYERKYREKIDFLTNIDFLGHWTDNQLSSLILNMEEVKVKRKHVIFREGDAPTHMYFIFKGEVEIQKNSENEKDNNNEKIGTLQRGASQRAIQNGKIFAKSKTIKIQEPIKLGILTEKGYFGESEAMDSRPREFTAIAHSSEVRLFSVTKEKFCAIVQDQKSIKIVRENGHKKNTLREERILKFSHRNASLEISEITPVEEMSPATKTHHQTSSEAFFKNPLSVPSTPAHANIFESNISMLPFNDQSMMGGLHYLDKGMGSGKIKISNALSLQKSISKVSSGSITDSELNHSKLIFQRQFTSLKNTKKGNATHIDRKKWIKQAIDVPVEQPSEIEETKETKETVTEKQIQYEIQENHDSLNFVKKGIPLTQIGKPGSLTCLSPIKAERKHNYNASLDCLDKIEIAVSQKQKDSIRHTRVTSIDNIKSMHLDTNTPRTAKSISIKSVKDMKKESLFAIKKIETSIKGILKKHQERVWPIQENGMPEKEYFSYRQPMAMNDGVSPRLPGSLASFRQSGDFIRNGLRNY